MNIKAAWEYIITYMTMISQHDLGERTTFSFSMEKFTGGQATVRVHVTAPFVGGNQVNLDTIMTN